MVKRLKPFDRRILYASILIIIIMEAAFYLGIIEKTQATSIFRALLIVIIALSNIVYIYSKRVK